MTDHDALIETLSGSAGAIRRPSPPLLRAGGWLLVTMIVGWLAIATVRRPWAVLNGSGDPYAWLALGATLAIGIIAIVAAFQMCIPGRIVRGSALLPVLLPAWALISLGGLATARWPSGAYGDGMYCFRFILTASLPMTVMIVVALRRTGSLHPRRTLAMASLGIGFLALSALAFCHPFSFTLIDTAGHLAAVAVVVALAVTIGSPWLAVTRR
jgi:hypothetical protein